MEKVCPWCGQPSDRGRLRNRTEQKHIWNSVPNEVVEANTVNAFKYRLDKHWSNQDVLFDFNADLMRTGSVLVCDRNLCTMRAKRNFSTFNTTRGNMWVQLQ